MPGDAHQPLSDPWIGRVVDNRYEITEHIGHGGMGTVYKVVHTQIGKIAAIKLLHANLTEDRELTKRFHREAEAISKLSNPNTVQVFDFGRVDQTVYLVMEYLKGEDLSTILRRDGPMPVERAAPILIQICDALTEAHDLGIIHRDLKPENVRVSRTRDGQDFIKVMDFGLAKILAEEDQDPSITAKGNLVGTPYYMAPELIRAQPIDVRADIYSLGAMSYRMLTGENAFIANTPVGVLTKHITDDLVPPSERAPERNLSRDVDELVSRAMAKDRDRRYRSADELKRDLLELLGSSSGTTASGLWQTPSGSLVITPQRRETDRAPLSVSQATILGELPTGRVEAGEVVVDPVLSKEDLAFERKLRRSRSLRLLLVLPVLAAIAVGVYWFGLREVELLAPPREIEPNNSPEQATPVVAGKPVLGCLGQRVSANESDRDWYRIDIPGGGPQLLRAEVSRIPNMDITIELYDSAAGLMTGVDSTGKAGGEAIASWPVGPGRHYLLVREVWIVDVPPTENVTDSYRLRVKLRPRSPGWEIEPNDSAKQASELQAGQGLKGHLGTVEDEDHISVRSGAALLAGMVSGIPGVDLVLQVTPSGASKPLEFDDEAMSSGERFDNIRADGVQPVRITLRRKDTSKATTRRAPGVDDPYTIKVWRKNAPDDSSGESPPP